MLGGALTLAAGCDRVAGMTDAAGKQAFEARCLALPPAGVDVVRAPNAVAVDDSRSGRDLEHMTDAGSGRHRTAGVTLANFGYRSTIDLEGLENARGERACARPRVHVEVALSSLTVYLAREYRGDPCREPLILAHEQRHVEVFERYADEAARTLARELKERVGNGVRYGPTMLALQDAVKADLAQWLESFMTRARAELAARNAAIDTSLEYEKLAQVCGPAS